VKSGSGSGDGAGFFGVGGLVGCNVGGVEIGLAVGFTGFEDIGRERRAAESLEVELFHQGTHNQLAAGDGFLNTEKGRGRRRTVEGVWKEVGARGEAFGRGAEGDPPAGAGFFKKQELGPILGADQASRNDFGVVEDEEVVFLE